MFKVVYRKSIQDNAYQILSELTGFCRRYDKKIGVLPVHSVVLSWAILVKWFVVLFVLFLNALLTFGACQTRTVMRLYNMVSNAA